MDPKISVIVACYNEQGNIVDTINRIHKTLPSAEIVVVDDGSSDKTAEVSKATKIPNLKIIRYTPNRGKGNAIRVGNKNSSGEIVAQVDADSQFPPEELNNLIVPIKEGKVDIVFASRFVKNSTVEGGSLTRMRRIANYVVSGFTSSIACCVSSVGKFPLSCNMSRAPSCARSSLTDPVAISLP